MNYVGHGLSRQKGEADVSYIKAMRHEKLLCYQRRVKSLINSVGGGM